MLSAVPRHWFSWDFTLQDSTRQPVAEVALSSWRERGSIRVAGIEYKLRRQGAPTGPFVLEGGDSVVARAVKPSAFRREFTIVHGERQYTLKARSALRRGCALFLQDEEIGSIAPEAWFSRRARVDLPDELPLLLRAFVVWLTMLLWKRDSDASAVSASAAYWMLLGLSIPVFGQEAGVVGGVPGGTLTREGKAVGLVLDYDEPPKPVKIIPPAYPKRALSEGTVELEIVTDRRGHVSRIRVVKSVPDLDAAAIDCVKKWMFKPAMKGGRPVATVAHAPLFFRKTNKPEDPK